MSSHREFLDFLATPRLARLAERERHARDGGVLEGTRWADEHPRHVGESLWDYLERAGQALDIRPGG